MKSLHEIADNIVEHLDALHWNHPGNPRSERVVLVRNILAAATSEVMAELARRPTPSQTQPANDKPDPNQPPT